MEHRRRRARVYLQMAICYKTWFGFVFYPVSFLLLLEKLSRFSYTSSLSRLLHVSSFLFLLVADAARYYLGTRGNVHRQVFHLTAFLFLSLCPLLPCVVYRNFVAEHRIVFDTIVRAIFVALLTWEVVLAMVVLHGLLHQETSRFVRLREATREKHKQNAFAAAQDGDFGHGVGDVGHSHHRRRRLDGPRGTGDMSSTSTAAC